MKKVLFVLFFIFSELHALTPFSLNGMKEATVHVADYSGLYDKKMKETLEVLMHKYMKKLGVKSHKFYNESLMLLLKSQKVGKIEVLFLDLMITGDVRRVTQDHLTFGITYLNKDNVEIENKEEDVIESLTFLLEEFSDQYIQDNEN